MKINYKILTITLLVVALVAVFLTSSVLAAPPDRNTSGKGRAGYGVQNGCGQENCQGVCDGTCEGTCDQNNAKNSRQFQGQRNSGRQGAGARGNGQGCDGSCLENK